MAKLIYIISAGHSGSTLLDILLGTFPNVFSTGELRYFTWQLYRTRNGEGSVKREDVCTCGKRFQDCEVWEEVIRKIEDEKKIDIINNPLTYNTTLLSHFKYKGKSTLPIRTMRKLISFEMYYLKNNFFSKFFKKYYIKEVKNVWKLIDTIVEVTNSDYVVDSSKNMLRYYLLKKERPNDVFLIVNSRDNFGYANSYIKQNIKPEISLKSKSKAKAKVSKLLKNIKPDYIKTNYRDIARNPSELLKKISIELNLKFNPEQIRDIDTRKFHLVAGNPTRYTGKLSIKYDNSWQHELSDELRNEIQYYIDKYKLNAE